MKLEKSYTKRKVDEAIVGIINQIKEFTYSQLYEIITKSKDPLVYAVSDTEYVLSRYIVVKTNDVWRVMTHLGDIDHDFHNKNSAIIYAIMLMQNKINLSEKIAKADTEVLYSKNEMDLYRAKLTAASKGQDAFKQELYAAKFSNSRVRYINAREDLEKTLRTAKYLKLGT
jgi:hypothetical protein